MQDAQHQQLLSLISKHTKSNTPFTRWNWL